MERRRDRDKGKRTEKGTKLINTKRKRKRKGEGTNTLNKIRNKRIGERQGKRKRKEY